MREKEVLLELRDSPFIITLYHTFKDEESLYFVFENCGLGGDLAQLISVEGRVDG